MENMDKNIVFYVWDYKINKKKIQKYELDFCNDSMTIIDIKS